LWECRANLIALAQYTPEQANGLMLQLAVDGMLGMPYMANFIQARDAIFLAVDLVDRPTVWPALWEGFAKRGLGPYAASPNGLLPYGVVEDTELWPIYVIYLKRPSRYYIGAAESPPTLKIALNRLDGPVEAGDDVTPYLKVQTSPGVWESVPMAAPDPGEPHIVQADFPEISVCGGEQDWYVQVDYDDIGGASGTVTEPQDAPDEVYDLRRYDSAVMKFADNFETDKGWLTYYGDDQPGYWERDAPPTDDDWYGPLTDHSQGTKCYFLHNVPYASEHTLESPAIDCGGLDPWVQYAFHFSQLRFKAEIYLDNRDGNPDNDWYVLEERRVEPFSYQYGAGYGNGPWRVSRFRIADFGPRRSSTKLRFTFKFTSQIPLWNAAALDDVRVWDMDCDPPAP
jgi:hypothetical protein